MLNPCVHLGPGIYNSPVFIWINAVCHYTGNVINLGWWETRSSAISELYMSNSLQCVYNYAMTLDSFFSDLISDEEKIHCIYPKIKCRKAPYLIFFFCMSSQEFVLATYICTVVVNFFVIIATYVYTYVHNLYLKQLVWFLKKAET